MTTNIASSGAWDCHFHILDAAAPVVANAVIANRSASCNDYRAATAGLGLTGGVLVQPSLYGCDHTVLLRALAELGAGYRATGVITPDADPATLLQWHAAGMRGMRFNQVQSGATLIEDMPKTAELVRDMGWSLELHLPASELSCHHEMLADLGVPLVLNHLGRCRPDHDEDLEALLRLYELPHVWVKLSGPYHEDVRDLSWAHSLDVAKRLITADSSRLVWGSDWPHVTESNPPALSKLLAFIQTAAGDETILRRIMSENPQRLYR
ncbi:MAG: amidohydrolase 2 [Martelella sp.]|uniref:amidohydrolase family protein n=1 Tax=unclassified Martelella TaxID=2629616 RepID=UPI000C389495|nr:amidohydrolase family protein [Martelella sp.]MAU21293.1 amidohydrolase 2 [Martelella sp.]|tara:strand:+ start:651 stop:1451 length:801 start_codon:yes stop_codon:yes gene_type:complete